MVDWQGKEQIYKALREFYLCSKIIQNFINVSLHSAEKHMFKVEW